MTPHGSINPWIRRHTPNGQRHKDTNKNKFGTDVPSDLP